MLLSEKVPDVQHFGRKRVERFQDSRLGSARAWTSSCFPVVFVLPSAAELTAPSNRIRRASGAVVERYAICA
jgi:hypothetical protein